MGAMPPSMPEKCPPPLTMLSIPAATVSVIARLSAEAKSVGQRPFLGSMMITEPAGDRGPRGCPTRLRMPLRAAPFIVGCAEAHNRGVEPIRRNSPSGYGLGEVAPCTRPRRVSFNGLCRAGIASDS